MTAQPLILNAAERAKAKNVLGVDVTVLASNAATSGYEITIQKGPKGMGPPPHSHAWDESFYILSGSVEVVCDGKTRLCEPGTLIHVPGGTVHGFQFGPDGGEMLEMTGATSRATQMFGDIADNISADAPDMAKAIALFQKNGVTVHL